MKNSQKNQHGNYVAAKVMALLNERKEEVKNRNGNTSQVIYDKLLCSAVFTTLLFLFSFFDCNFFFFLVSPSLPALCKSEKLRRVCENFKGTEI